MPLSIVNLSKNIMIMLISVVNLSKNSLDTYWWWPCQRIAWTRTGGDLAEEGEGRATVEVTPPRPICRHGHTAPARPTDWLPDSPAGESHVPVVRPIVDLVILVIQKTCRMRCYLRMHKDTIALFRKHNAFFNLMLTHISAIFQPRRNFSTGLYKLVALIC